MRMRFKPYAHDELMAADFHVHEPLIWGGRWHAQYARPEQPFILELGCGKGGFISQLACAHPENNYLGIDITDKVLILAKRKIEAAYQAAGRPIDNVKIMSTDIERIKGVITAEDTVSRIYINFCNPWSKNDSSHKHRLTYPRQLIAYREFLKDGGEIYFKTDDDDLFRDSVEYFPASGYDIEWMTFDLHENEPEWNIRTEHEGMFTEMGIKIKALALGVHKPRVRAPEPLADPQEIVRRLLGKKRVELLVVPRPLDRDGGRVDAGVHEQVGTLLHRHVRTARQRGHPSHDLVGLVLAQPGERLGRHDPAVDAPVRGVDGIELVLELEHAGHHEVLVIAHKNVDVGQRAHNGDHAERVGAAIDHVAQAVEDVVFGRRDLLDSAREGRGVAVHVGENICGHPDLLTFKRTHQPGVIV